MYALNKFSERALKPQTEREDKATCADFPKKKQA